MIYLQTLEYNVKHTTYVINKPTVEMKLTTKK